MLVKSRKEPKLEHQIFFIVEDLILHDRDNICGFKLLIVEMLLWFNQESVAVIYLLPKNIILNSPGLKKFKYFFNFPFIPKKLLS